MADEREIGRRGSGFLPRGSERRGEHAGGVFCVGVLQMAGDGSPEMLLRRCLPVEHGVVALAHKKARKIFTRCAMTRQMGWDRRESSG